MEIDKFALEALMQTGGEVGRPVVKGNTIFDIVSQPFMRASGSWRSLEHLVLKGLLHNAVVENVGPLDHVGLFLSGGVDSVTLMRLITLYTDTKVTAYHLDWKYPPRAELKYAEMAAKYCGVDLKVIDVSPMNQIPHMETALMLTRSIDYSIIAVYMACKAMKADGIRFAVNALGLDEYFAGYPLHRKIYKRAEGYTPHFIPYIKSHNKLARGVMRYFGNEEAFFKSNSFISPNRPFVNGVTRRNLEDLIQGFYMSCKANNLWNTSQHWTLLHMFYNYATNIMRAGDAAGIGVVFPYIERELLEYSINIHPLEKVNKAPIRWLMRNSYGLPDELAARGEDWSDLSKWDKYAFGGTVLPYFECMPFMQRLTEYRVKTAEQWFTPSTIKQYLEPAVATALTPAKPSHMGLQMLLFLKMMEMVENE